MIEIQVYDEGASYLMTDTMKGVLTSGTATRYKLNYPHSAAKTGTTNDAKDVWICGYTPYYSMAVWVGDDDPKPQNSMKAQGYIFQNMMNYLNNGKEIIDFEIPECVNITEEGIISYTIQEKENIRSNRNVKENERKSDEIKKQNTRLSDLSYRIEYGLSDEEEKARELSAKKLLDQLRDYELTSINQFTEVSNLISDVYYAINQIKNTSVYEEYMDDYDNIRQNIESQKTLLIEQENQNQNNLWQDILNQRINEENLQEESNEEPITVIPNPSPSITPPSERDDVNISIEEDKSNETPKPTETSSETNGNIESGT